MNEKEKVILLITQICSKVPIDQRDSYTRAINGPTWKLTKEGTQLLGIIRDEETLEIFNNHLQQIGHVATIVTLEQLADWMIQRSYLKQPSEVVNDLIRYISLEEIELDFVELIIGVSADCEYEFCNEVKLTSPQNLKNSSFANSLVQDTITSQVPLPRVSMVLVCPYKQSIEHNQSTKIRLEPKLIDLPNEELEDVMLCLSLARQPSDGIFSIAQTSIAPDNLPFIQSISAYNLKPFKISNLQGPILRVEMYNADNILKKFITLSPYLKDRLKIPMKKLNDFGSRIDKIGQAIDLRICLESIFLNEGNKEQLRYRLALRAALFLADNLEDRKSIFKLIKDTYDLTSSAVHNGKFSKKSDLSLLIDSSLLARKAIIKLIKNGDVNWEELELNN